MRALPSAPEEAAAVVDAAAEELARRLGSRLVSLYAIGSLAHGGFAPAVSDVDLAVLVDRCTAEVPELVAAATAATRRRLGTALADRLSIFHGDWVTFAAPGATARFPAIDRLDLMEHGVLLRGEDRRATAGTVPSHAQLVDATRAFLAAEPLQSHDPVALVRSGPRPLTKAVLFPVRFLYTLERGRAGSNEDAARWYCGDGRPAAPLVERAMRWRGGAVEHDEAVALVRAHLGPLQEECAAAFAV